jgi:hypothetical protein
MMMKLHLHRPHLTHRQAVSMIMGVVVCFFLGEGLVLLHYWSRRDNLEVTAILLTWSREALLVLKESLFAAEAAA